MIKKNNENLKPASDESKKKFLKGLKKGVICFVAGIGIFNLGYTASRQIKYRAFINDLTTEKKMVKNAEEVGINNNLANLKSPRVVFPRNGLLTINVKFPESTLTPDMKNLLQKNVDEINRVFKFVNPKYSVKLEYDPKNFKNLYFIDLYENNLLKTDVLGTHKYEKVNSTLFNGVGAYGSRVEIDLSKLNKYIDDKEEYESRFSDTFLHEVLGHAIGGMADAYGKEEFEHTSTIMGYGGSSNLKAILPLDLKILLVKYSKDSDYDNWNEKANEYFNTTEWYMEKLKEVKYLKANYFDELKNTYYYTMAEAEQKDFQVENLGDIYFTNADTYLERFSDGKGGRYSKGYSYLYNLKDNFEKGDLKLSTYDFFDNRIETFEGPVSSYEIDGVRYSMLDDSFLIKYDDNLIALKVNKDESGDYTINNIKWYDILTKEQYNKSNESQKWEKIIYSISDGEYFDRRYKNVADDYCEDNGIEIVELPELKGLNMTVGYNSMSDMYSFDDEKDIVTVTTSNNSGYSFDRDYRYKMLGEYALCSNGEIIMNTKDDGLKVLRTQYDFNQNAMGFSSCNDVISSSINYNKDKENVDQPVGDTEIENSNNSDNANKSKIFEELYDFARKIVIKDKQKDDTMIK